MRAGWGTLTVDARLGVFKPAGHTGESGIKVNIGAGPFKAALKLAATKWQERRVEWSAERGRGKRVG